MRRFTFSLPLQVCVAAALGYFGVTFVTQPQSSAEMISGLTSAATAKAECNIKGNISIDSGERIYHVPGQRYYSATKIEQRYGERWFCSEAEAMAAGWRRSRQ